MSHQNSNIETLTPNMLLGVGWSKRKYSTLINSKIERKPILINLRKHVSKTLEKPQRTQ